MWNRTPDYRSLEGSKSSIAISMKVCMIKMPSYLLVKTFHLYDVVYNFTRFYVISTEQMTGSSLVYFFLFGGDGGNSVHRLMYITS